MAIKRYIRTGKPSLKGRFLCIVGLLTILPIFIVASVGLIWSGFTEWDARLSSVAMLADQIQITFDKLIEPFDRLLISYAANADIFQVLNASDPDAEYSDEELNRRHLTVSSFLKRLGYANEDVLNIRFALDTGERFLAYGGFYSYNEDAIEKAVNQLRESDAPYSMILIMPEYRYLQSGTRRYAISLIRLLYDEAYRCVGFGVIFIKQKIFSENLTLLTDNKELQTLGANVLVYNGDDIFFQSDTGSEIPADDLNALRDESAGGGMTLMLNENRCMVYGATSSYTGLTTATYIPYSILYQKLLSTMGIVGLFALSAIAIMLMASKLFDRHVAKPLNTLSAIMTNGAVQPSYVEDRQLVFSEIESLYTAYNAMIVQNKLLQEKEVEYRDNQARLEQLTLSMQINPHYFGNVLSMISARAYVDGMQDIVRICENMAATFRYTIKSPMIVTLSDELEMIDRYVQILRDLYDRPLTLEYDIAEGCEKIPLPKVTLQPLVENAVIHSILYKADASLVLLRAYCNDQYTFVEVADDGAGLAPAELALLQESMKEDMDRFLRGEKRSIGLKTVHYRIVQQFGASYGVSIASQPDVQTTVTIKLPRVPFGEEG